MIIVDCSSFFNSNSLACDQSAFKNLASLVSASVSSLIFLFYIFTGLFTLLLKRWKRSLLYLFTALAIFLIRYPWHYAWNGEISIP